MHDVLVIFSLPISLSDHPPSPVSMSDVTYMYITIVIILPLGIVVHVIIHAYNII